jgi:hypothetical protein
MQKQTKKPLLDFLTRKASKFLSKTDNLPRRTYLYDFNQMAKEVKPCDVLLIESHTRIGNIVRLISESPWTHAALYIGRLSDIQDETLREIVSKHAKDLSSDQLLIESIIDKGTIISPLDKYKNEHIRILRPSTLLPEDAQKVIANVIQQIGHKYSLRHLFDLGRFIFPWRVLPREWRSSLFQQNISQSVEDICSSMIANAFQSVNYPILPAIEEKDEEGHTLIHRNPRLYTPSDFDVSPFFDIIKYPIFPLKEGKTYRDLPWKKQGKNSDF